MNVERFVNVKQLINVNMRFWSDVRLEDASYDASDDDDDDDADDEALANVCRLDVDGIRLLSSLLQVCIWSLITVHK